MKAIVYTNYGSPDVLELKEIERPVPRDNEVLVKVCAVSVNASDWELLTGKPLYARFRGILKPKYQILGSDIAGRVETIGCNVSRLQPGDEVFGDIFECMGGFAEYVCVAEDMLMLKPVNMTFEGVAALPQSVCIALQGIRDKGQTQPGQKVLINGAGGGAGSFAVQFAKLFGAEVTGVDNTSKLDMMRSIGADYVIDYTQEDFTKNGQCYDLILDLVAYHSVFDYKRALSTRGVYIMVGGSVALMLRLLILGPVISLFSNKKMAILPMKPNKDLAFILEQLDAGKVAPVIDKHYTLSEVPDALAYFGAGNVKGKVIINVGV